MKLIGFTKRSTSFFDWLSKPVELFPISPEIILTKEEAIEKGIPKEGGYINVGGIKLFGKTFLPTSIPITISKGG